MSRKALWTIAAVVAAAILAFGVLNFSGRSPGQEAHAICPVCQMMVNPATAPKSAYKGKDYFFCSQEHKQQFDAAPGKFLTAPPARTP